MNQFMPVFWQRMGEVRLFTWGYLGFHVWFMVTMRLFLNYSQIMENLLFWLAIVVLEHSLIFAYLGISRNLITKYSNRFVILSALLIGFIRTAITTGLQLVLLNDAQEVDWSWQLALGSIFELLIVTLWANVNGAYRQYRNAAQELNQTRSSLLGYRENAEQILADEQESLIRATRESLLPQLKSIEASLAKTANAGESINAATELRLLLNERVRPLTESLRTSAIRLVAPVKTSRGFLQTIIMIAPKSRVTKSIFPLFTYLVMTLSYAAAPLWLLDSSWIPTSMALSTTYFLIAWLNKYLTRNWPPMPSVITALLLLIVAVESVIPTFFFIIVLHPGQESAWVLGWALTWCSIMATMILAYLESLDYQARQYLTDLEIENEQLTGEMSEFEQQLWAARKNWSLIIHGTVQAALTAALTRINSSNPSAQNIELAKFDLQRAINALNQPPELAVDLPSALQELIETWRGVCEISLEVQPETLSEITQNNRSSMCVNEILKEAVSNAVRHADATEVNVQITKGRDALLMQIRNNGQDFVATNRKGLGSTMLDELTIDWQLAADPKTEQTLLTARLPFLAVPA